jgi:hypothetical protein
MPCRNHTHGSGVNFDGKGSKYDFRKKHELYRIYYQGESFGLVNDVLLPVVPVTIRIDIDGRPKIIEHQPFIVDTTSDFSYIPRDLAVKFGIDITSGVPIALRGLEGGVKAYLKEGISIRIDPFEASVPIRFAIPERQGEKDLLPCLGIDCIFDHYVFAIGWGCTRVFENKAYTCGPL